MEREWAQRAREYLKAEIKRANLTYLMLARRLVEDGFEETPASIAIKLAGGNLTAHFFSPASQPLGMTT